MKPIFGRKHKYLRMKINIHEDKKIEIDMKDQIEEIINGFSEDVSYKVTTPATRNLMNVNESAESLSDEKAAEFHTTTAKLLYLEKRARPDLEPTVTFLTTRVSNPNTDDWHKLKRALTFLNGTKNDTRVICGDTLNHIFTWIDAAYAVHSNM